METARNNEDLHRFEVDIGAETAVLEYRVGNGQLILLHTGVPAAAQGKGVGNDLMRAAVEHARASGMKLVPRCAFAAGWLRRHSDHSDIVEWEQ